VSTAKLSTKYQNHKDPAGSGGESSIRRAQAKRKSCGGRGGGKKSLITPKRNPGYLKGPRRQPAPLLEKMRGEVETSGLEEKKRNEKHAFTAQKKTLKSIPKTPKGHRLVVLWSKEPPCQG